MIDKHAARDGDSVDRYTKAARMVFSLPRTRYKGLQIVGLYNYASGIRREEIKHGAHARRK